MAYAKTAYDPIKFFFFWQCVVIALRPMASCNVVPFFADAGLSVADRKSVV